MGAYLPFAATAFGQTDDDTTLRALPIAGLRGGQMVQLLDGGLLAFWIVRWDPTETAADDGVKYFTPDSITEPAPGRWVTFAATDVVGGVLVMRKSDGTIDGAGGGGTPDFTAPVLHVNEGGTTPSTGLYGLSVFYTAGAARKGLFYDAANATWVAATDTLGDDATISGYLPLRVAALKVESVENAAGGTAASGLLRLATGDEIRARVGSEYRLVAALAGPVLAFGDATATTTTIDASGLIRATVASGTIDLRAGGLTIKDALGAATILDVSASGQTFKVYSRLIAYNGGTAVLDVDVGSTAGALNGRWDVNDPTGAANYFHVNSGVTETRGDFTAKNLGATADVFKVTGATAIAQVNGELLIKDATGTTTLLDAASGTSTVAVTGLTTVTRSALGTTKTFGLVVGNDTVSGTQVSPEIALYAFHSGGTRHNVALQVEPQSATRVIVRGLYGTGTSPPTSTFWTLDNSDPNYGVALTVSTLVAGSGGNGVRLANNGGGMKEDGSSNAIFQNAASGSIWSATSSTSTGNTGARFQFTADAGTPSAGYLARWGYGSGSFSTSVLDLFFNGRLGLANVDPTVAGQLGMNTTTGRARLFVGGVADSVAVLADIGGAALQSGVATLTSGVTGNITAVITANTRIVVSVKTPSGTMLTTEWSALDADRTVGATGPFKITALVAAGTINTADNSTVDWIAIG